MSDNFSNSFGNSTINYVVKTTAINASLNLQAAFSLYVVTAASVIITLPVVTTVYLGWSVKVKNTSTGAISVANSSLIDGSASVIIESGESIEVIMSGSTYIVSNKSLSAITGTHVTTWSGAWSPAQSNNIYWSKIGKQVVLTFPFKNVTASSSGTLNMVIPLPSNLLPDKIYNLSMSVLNVSRRTGLCNVLPTGNITIYGTDGAGNFTNNNNCGFDGNSVVYLAAS